MYLQFLRTVDKEHLAEMLGDRCRPALAITKATGEFLWANKSWCRMLGYTLDELIDSVHWDALTSGEADLEADRKQVARLMAGEEVEYEVVKFYITKFGERLHVRVIVSRFPKVGPVDWFFVQAQIIGDEERQAMLYTTQQLENLGEQVRALVQQFGEANRQLLSRIDALIAQQAKQLELAAQQQWVARLMSALLERIAKWAESHPTWAAIVVLTVLTLWFGDGMIDTLKKVAALFGVRLGIDP